MEKQTHIPEELEHETTIRGAFNGEKFELKGKGRGRPYDGKLESRLETTSGQALPFSMHLLDIVAIFGYPTYSKYQDGTTELFKSSDGYEYERHIKYENGGWMNTLHKIVWRDGRLNGDFQVLDGECKTMPELEGIEPIVETFIPAGPGKIKSRCVIAWRKTGGGLFTADCESEYRLKHSRSLPLLQFRMVEFNTNHTKMVLDQKETLDVIRTLPRP